MPLIKVKCYDDFKLIICSHFIFMYIVARRIFYFQKPYSDKAMSFKLSSYRLVQLGRLLTAMNDIFHEVYLNFLST